MLTDVAKLWKVVLSDPAGGRYPRAARPAVVRGAICVNIAQTVKVSD